MDLIEKVRRLLVKPKDTLPVLKAEPEIMQGLLIYICILALIPMLAVFIGKAVIGIKIGEWGRFRAPVGYALITSLVLYILTVGSVLLIGFIIDLLAPNFGGSRNYIRALKTAAYSSTPFMLGGILAIFNSTVISVLWLVIALYGIYILFLALPIFMESPIEQNIFYSVVTVAGAIVLSFISGLIVYNLNNVFMMSVINDTLNEIGL
jgi:hypothetical protein